jgi:enamine deaminase RidA (YjgF/YER057c/UK114 family)
MGNGMTIKRRGAALLAAGLLAVSGVAAAGCDSEDDINDQIDQAQEDVQGQLEDAQQDIEDEVNQAQEDVSGQIEDSNVGDQAEELQNDAQDQIDQAQEQLDELDQEVGGE